MRKTTKKALLLSALSLFACVAMLVGTTFAWFTDSVTSAGNKIQAGTLQIDLEVLDKVSGEFNSIKESSAPLFNYENWEPGYTEAVVLKLENEGSLALKWVAKFVSEYELTILADVIDVYVLKSDAPIAYPADRDLTGYVKVGTVAQFVNTISQTTNGYLLADSETYMGIALKMQESAGNEYQGLSLGGAFDIQIFATQYTYEEDSFDEMYDEMAVVSNAADLQAAIAAGENVILNGDIVATAPIVVANDAAATIDLNGHTISRVDADADKNDDGKFTSSDNTYIFKVNGSLSVQGEGSIVLEHTGDNMGWNALSAVFSVEAGELTLGEDVSVFHMGGTDMAYAVDVNTTLGETVLNIDGATLYSSYVGVRIFNNNKTQKGIVNYNSGIVSGGSRDIWAQQANGNCPVENAVINTEIPYTTNNAGDRYYFDTADVVVGATELKDTLNNASAGDVIIANGVVVEGTTGLNNPGVTVIGATFKNEGGQAVSGTIAGTYKDCVFEGAETLRWCYTNAGETLVFENCVIETSLRGIHFDVMDGNVIFKNCVIAGFNAFSGNGTMTFEGCTFGYSDSNYNGLNIYTNTNLIDCTFEFVSGKTNFIDMEGTGKTLTITNCTATLDGADADVADFVGGSKLAQNTVIYG